MKKVYGCIILSVLICIDLCGQKNDSKNMRLGGYATITGKIQNYSKDNNIIEIGIDDWEVANRRQFFIQIDTTGNFEGSFFAFNPQGVLFIYNNKWHNIFIAPNDTLVMTIDSNKFPENNQYEGAFAKSCAEYLNYYKNKELLFPDNRDKDFNRKDFIIWRDSVFKVEKNVLREYSEVNSLDGFFEKWLVNEIELRYVIDIMKYYSFNKDIVIDSLALCSIMQIDSTFINNSSSYSFYINQLAGLLSRPCGEETIKRIKSIQRSKLSVEGVSNRNNLEIDILSLEIDFFMCFVEMSKVVKDELVRETLIAHMYTNSLRKKLNFGVELAIDEITDSRIRALLYFTQNQYDLKNSSGMSLSLCEPSTIKGLKDKYKGYVVFVDFWSVWCGPCLSQLKQMREVEEKFTNQKVKFVYLCCRSDEEKWKNIISKLNLCGEHILINSGEYANLANEFDIISVPKYLIIGKDGTVHNTKSLYHKSSIIDAIQRQL